MDERAFLSIYIGSTWLSLRFDNATRRSTFIEAVNAGSTTLRPVYQIDGLRLSVRPSAVDAIATP